MPTSRVIFIVGEVATALLVVMGTYFVGEQVLKLLKAFISRVTDVNTDAELEEAAKLFAQVMVMGTQMVVTLLTRTRSRAHSDHTVLRMKGGCGGGNSGHTPGGGQAGVTPPANAPATSRGVSPKGKPKGGAGRASAYGRNWPKGSLKDAITKFAPETKGVPNAKGDKIIYKGADGKQIVHDPAGNYYRSEDTTLPGKRKYLDMDGNVPNNKVENGRVRTNITKSLIKETLTEL